MAKSNLSGVTYYKLEKRYEGDVTKNCGLTGAEIDANFHFLRGRDIKSIELTEEGVLEIALLDGTVLKVDNFKDYISSAVTQSEINPTLSGSTYDKENGILSLILNDEEYEIGGFLTKNDIGIYVTRGLKGNGSECNPIRIPGVEDTGVFAPVDKYIEGPVEENDADKEKRYLSKEKISEQGYFYNFNGVKEIESILLEENNGWKVPSFDDLAGMLNGLEYCDEEYQNHDNRNEGLYGKDAGFAVKSDSWDDDPLGNNSLCLIEIEDGFSTLWSNEELEDKILSKAFVIHHGDVANITLNKIDFYPIRLVKDITCDGEGGGIYTINGKPYETVQMTHILSGVTSSKLWTKTNIAISLENCELYEDADSGETYYKYFVNEYDNILNRWLKKELKNGYSVVIKEYGEEGNEEFINKNGELISKWATVKNYVDNSINIEKEERIDADNEEKEAREAAVSELTEAIEEEKRIRAEEDEKEHSERVNDVVSLTEQITQEAIAREEAINNEQVARENSINELNERIEAEKQARIGSDEQISENLENAVSELNNSIEEEAATRRSAIDRVEQEIGNETRVREQLLNQEIEQRREADAALSERINENRSAITENATEIRALKTRVSRTESGLSRVNEEILDINETIQNLDNKIENETHDRIVDVNNLRQDFELETDRIKQNLSSETITREQYDVAIIEALTKEVRDRTNADNAEKREREESDNTIKILLSAETADRIRSIEEEAGERIGQDNILRSLISSETRNRIESLATEKELRENADNEIARNLSVETQRRKEVDELLHREIIEGLYQEAEKRMEGDERLHTEIALIVGTAITIVDGLLDLSASTVELSAATAGFDSRISNVEQEFAETKDYVQERLEREKEEREASDSAITALVSSGLSSLGQKIAEEKQEREEADSEIMELVNSGLSALSQEMQEVNSGFSALTESFEEFKADYSAETENIWFAINEKEAAVISRDIVFTGKTGEQVTIHSGESVTDAIETVALNAGGGGGGGDGKVKDILVNDNSILDEETGIADLNIENADADISIEMTGTTMYVNVTGISNNVIDLT